MRRIGSAALEGLVATSGGLRRQGTSPTEPAILQACPESTGKHGRTNRCLNQVPLPLHMPLVRGLIHPSGKLFTHLEVG